MPRVPRGGFVALLLLVALTGCAGETFVEYRGTVTAAAAPGHAFSPDPNPAALPAVPSAAVTLRVCSGTCRGDERALTATAGPDGGWGPLEATFGGLSDHQILIEVIAPGYQPYTYAAVYEDTGDPTAGEQWLNVTLVPDE